MHLQDDDLILRPFRPDDRDRLVFVANNPSVARYLTLTFPHPYLKEDADIWLEEAVREVTHCNFAIEWRGELVGGAGLTPMSDLHGGTADMGYWLGESYWGRGLAARAVALLVPYAFEELLFIRLQALVFRENAASIRVLEKSGFVCEGIMRKHIRKNGKISDAALYAKLRND